MNLKTSLCHFAFCAILLLSKSLNAENLISRTYEFEPDKPQIIDNPLFWKLDTWCDIETNENEDLLAGVMKKKNGEINGNILKEGQSISILVRNKDKMHILADVGAKVEITNLGTSIVIATCKI